MVVNGGGDEIEDDREGVKNALLPSCLFMSTCNGRERSTALQAAWTDSKISAQNIAQDCHVLCIANASNSVAQHFTHTRAKNNAAVCCASVMRRRAKVVSHARHYALRACCPTNNGSAFV